MSPDARATRRAYRRRRRQQRGWLRALRHRLRPLASRPLMGLALRIAPPLYVAYMRFVWATSRVVDHGVAELPEQVRKHGGALALLWHEEVVTVAYGYWRAGLRPHTLASRSDLGEIITRLLERCGYTVYRGGSTRHRSRRGAGVLDEMIEHMRERDDVLYGLTVDGSHGPPYHLKRGGVVIARECDKPIFLIRTWYRRCLRLRNWDRTGVPAPWNEIHHYLEGPYFAPPDAGTPEGLERFRARLERDLHALAMRSYADVGQPAPERLRRAVAAAPADPVR